jgi:hypothetical protein
MIEDFGKLQYQVECISCHSLFRLDHPTDYIPKHPPKGTPGNYWAYIPCVGSNTIGRFITTKYKGMD